MLTLLYDDKDLVVCLKPPAVPSQPDPTGSEDMTALLARQLGLPQADLGIVHRLDRPVGGVMVYTKTKKAMAGLSRQLQSQGFGKSYLAVCCGLPEPPEGALSHWLLRDGRTNSSRAVAPGRAGAKEARLSYRLTAQTAPEAWGPLGLLQVQLETGRHHQIRVQLAAAGFPLWGDTKYNPLFQKRSGWFQIGLFSRALSFSHPVTGKPMTFTAQPPEDQEPFSFFSRSGL